MDMQELIDHLKNAPGPSRELDHDIALALGYRRRVEDESDHSRVLWVVPTGDEVKRLPAFTFSLERAIELSRMFIPSNVGAVLWNPRASQACFEGGRIYQAATPAMAICLALLNTLNAKRTDD